MHESKFETLLNAFLEGAILDQELADLHQAVLDSSEHRKRFREATRLHVMLRETMNERVELLSIAQGVFSNDSMDERHGEGMVLDCREPASDGGGGFNTRDAAPGRVVVTSGLRSQIGMWSASAVFGVLMAVVLSGGLFYWYSLEPNFTDAPVGVCLSLTGADELNVYRGKGQGQLYPGAVLYTGDRVDCGGQTRAMLQLSDGSILSMEPSSRVTLTSASPQVDLDRGEVLFEIAERQADEQSFEVSTGQSTVEVKGTVFTLAASDHTELQVFEGIVTLTRHRDQSTVNVGALQGTTTKAEGLVVQPLETPLPAPAFEILSLLPTDDATLDRSQSENGSHLKVEGNRRVVYLRFDIPNVGAVDSARLRLTQSIDPGSGTLRFFLGEHADWQETQLSKDTAPLPGPEIVRHTGPVGRGEVVEVDVSQAVQGSGAISLLIFLDKSDQNDIWFGSRQSKAPPQLILSYPAR